MREIKFRGKRKNTKEWVYGFYYKQVSHDKLSINNDILLNVHLIRTMDDSVLFDDLFLAIEVDPETVEQFTGLKDKNGVDIYEGDIIRVISMGRIETVFYHKCAFCIKVGEELVSPIYHSDDLEIEGTIHD